MNKLKEWTNEEIEELSNDYGVLSPKELEIKYCINYNSLRRFCSRLKIKSKRNIKKRLWTNEEIKDFKKDWQDNILTWEELEVKYARQYNSLKGKAKDLKIHRITNVEKLTEEDIINICYLYNENNINSTILSKKYKVCVSSIINILNENNIKIKDNSHSYRKYSIDENYFNIIDDEHKAYWLGFLYADGNNKEDRSSVALTLQEQDNYILTEFLNDLKLNNKIHTTYNKKYNKKYYSLNIYNKKISLELKNKGVVNNKTFISSFPSNNIVPSNLIRHFIRGVFDGDGCISLSIKGVNKNRIYATFSIVNGNKNFLNDLNMQLPITVRNKLHKTHNVYQINYSKKEDIIKLYKYLYDGATIFLIRKKDKFIKYMEEIKMNDKIAIIESLVKQLNQYSYEYYTLDNPSISDKEYDKKYNELLQLEKETNIILPNSPTQKIGGEILSKFEKIIHKNKLWSLDKCQSFDELREWHKKNIKFCIENNLPKPTYIVTKKYDGLTIKCDYKDNKYIKGSSRGTGEIGEDLSSQVKTIINLPMELKNNDELNREISFHGEGLMTKKAFEEYNKISKTPLKNLRNGSSGALRNLNPKETAKRKLIIMFYNINDIEHNFQTYHEQLEYIKYRGLPVTDYKICNTIEEVINEVNNIETKRPNLPYDIDGAVISINDIMTRNKMGYTIKYPKFSMAYKYEAQEDTTKLIDVEWNVSRTGKIIPTGILEPVELNGATIERATLNNLTDIKRKGLKLNCDVFIRRSNDVIPEITGIVEKSLKNNNVKNIEIPTKCPVCSFITEIRTDKESSKLYCTNPNCKAKLVQRLTHYCSRNAMNIEGLSEKTLEKFIELGFIKDIDDIYFLQIYKEDIIKLEGFGIRSYEKLINSIDKSKQCKLENFIFAIGIPQVGKSTAKDLVNYYNTLQPIVNSNISDLLNIKDMGEVTANSIRDYFNTEDNITLINNIVQYLTFIKEEEIETNTDGVLQGKSYYLTGTFLYGKKTELKELVESNGGIFAEKFNKQIDVLVIGGVKGSSKDKKAKDWNIPVISEDGFLKMVGDK